METVIEVRNLVKRYGDLVAVNGVDLEVRAGEVYSILGPNGAGKTTSVEIMECLRMKTSGEVRILGHDIDKGQREIRKRIGVLPQSFNAFDFLTVKENIEYFGGLFDRTIATEELIEAVEALGRLRLVQELQGTLVRDAEERAQARVETGVRTAGGDDRVRPRSLDLARLEPGAGVRLEVAQVDRAPVEQVEVAVE